MTTERLAGRVALVTGASRGLGRAIALRYAQEGAIVVPIARTLKDLESLDDEIKQATGNNALLVPENLTDFVKIDQVALALGERFGKLDILVGAAAMLGQLSPMGHYKPKMWADVFDLNVHANWRLIRALDRLLRTSDAGRSIFVTSSVAVDPRMYWGPYAASKAALEQMVRIYANEIGHTNMRANLVNPGAMRTKMRALAYPGEDPAKLPTPDQVTDIFVTLAEPACAHNGATLNAQADVAS